MNEKPFDIEAWNKRASQISCYNGAIWDRVQEIFDAHGGHEDLSDTPQYLVAEVLGLHILKIEGKLDQLPIVPTEPR